MFYKVAGFVDEFLQFRMNQIFLNFLVHQLKRQIKSFENRITNLIGIENLLHLNWSGEIYIVLKWVQIFSNPA